jgi:beta-glucanase (GH16 family)
MEHVCSLGWISGYIHFENNGHAQYGNTTSVNVGSYHVYSAKRTANQITWYVDGNQYSVADIDNAQYGNAELRNYMNIRINLSVGGGYPGSQGCNNPNGVSFPQRMYCDYIRVQ